MIWRCLARPRLSSSKACTNAATTFDFTQGMLGSSRSVDQGQIDGFVWGMQLVRGPAVTIHAIHSPNSILRRIVLEFRIAIFEGNALRICHSHPRELRELVVRRDIFDFVGNIHVPVNAALRSVRRVAAADVEQEANGERRVFFVRKKMLVSAFDVADVFLRPVALLTNRLSRARIGCGDMNRAIKIVAHGVIKLFHSVEFRLEVRGRARADVTRHALHACVCGVLKRNELRFHRKMACLAAELNRFCNLVGLITPKSGQK